MIPPGPNLSDRLTWHVGYMGLVAVGTALTGMRPYRIWLLSWVVTSHVSGDDFFVKLNAIAVQVPYPGMPPSLPLYDLGLDWNTSRAELLQ